METNFHAENVMKRVVEITVSSYTEQRVLLNAVTYQGETLASDISFDDLFDREDLIPNSVVHPLHVPDVVVSGLRREMADLVAFKKELYDLRSERASTCDRKRWDELESGDGPIRTLERKQMVKAFIVKVMLKAQTGVWPSEFRDLDIH